MSKPRDSVQMCLVEEGTVVCIDVVGHDKWGTDMGGKLYVDLECLPWLIEAVQGYLRDGKASQRAFSRDELKVSASGSDYWPRLAIESVRAEDAPHGGLSMQSMRPELGPDLVALRPNFPAIEVIETGVCHQVLGGRG